MNRVLEHESGDLTCTVEAGIRLSALAAALAPARQRLSLDPPGDPTIGACLAENLSGPLRHRFGAPRDLVLGVTLVLGTARSSTPVARSSRTSPATTSASSSVAPRGRLAFIGRVSLRLHPDPRDCRDRGSSRRATRRRSPQRCSPPSSSRARSTSSTRPRRNAVRGRRRRGRCSGRRHPRARRRRGRRTARVRAESRSLQGEALGPRPLAPGDLRAFLDRTPTAVVRPSAGVAYPPLRRRRPQHPSRYGACRSGCASASTRQGCWRDGPRPTCSARSRATASTAGSASRPARRTCSGTRRWTPRVAGSS